MKNKCNICGSSNILCKNMCKICYNKLWRIKNRKKLIIRGKIYYEKNKKELCNKKREYFKINKIRINHRQRKYYKNNPEKYKIYSKRYAKHKKEYLLIYRKKNKLKIKKQRKRYYKTNNGSMAMKQGNHNRRARKFNIKHNFTSKQWMNKLNKTKGICPGYNRKPHFVGKDKLTLDHILPISLAPKGFEYTIDDIQPLCVSCNSTKHNRYNWSKGEIHHVSISVDDIGKYIKYFEEEFSTRLMFRGNADEFDVECAFLDTKNIFIELIKGNTKNNSVSKFVKKHGCCYHHMAFIVDKKDDTFKKGALPRMWVKFTKPKETGIVIEYVYFDE